LSYSSFAKTIHTHMYNFCMDYAVQMSALEVTNKLTEGKSVGFKGEHHLKIVSLTISPSKMNKYRLKA
jgi:hypothetical protein